MSDRPNTIWFAFLAFIGVFIALFVLLMREGSGVSASAPLIVHFVAGIIVTLVLGWHAFRKKKDGLS